MFLLRQWLVLCHKIARPGLDLWVIGSYIFFFFSYCPCIYICLNLSVGVTVCPSANHSLSPLPISVSPSPPVAPFYEHEQTQIHLQMSGLVLSLNIWIWLHIAALCWGYAIQNCSWLKNVSILLPSQDWGDPIVDITLQKNKKQMKYETICVLGFYNIDIMEIVNINW